MAGTRYQLNLGATRGAKVTMQALQLGASDFVLKPTDSPVHGVRQVGEQLQTMIRVYGGRHRKSYPGTDSSPQPEAIQPPQPSDSCGSGQGQVLQSDAVPPPQSPVP